MSPLPLRFQWALPPLMLMLLPWHQCLELTPGRAGLFEHFAYPFAHAGVLHWLLNSLAWMFLWRTVTFPRLFCAWLVAAGIGWLYPLWGSEPLCGFSVIVCFFVGRLLPRCTSAVRLQIVIPAVAAFFIPHIAAFVHLLAFIAGLAYCRFIPRPHNPHYPH